MKIIKKAVQTALSVAANGESIGEVIRYKRDPDNKTDGFSRLGQMARAALNQDWFDLAKLGFEALVDLISGDPLSYQEFLSAVSQYADAKILFFSDEECLRFVGGECLINVVEAERVVTTNVQLYFKNGKGSWIKKELNGKTDFDSFSKEALEGELSDILEEGGRKYPITDPEKE